MRRRQAFVAFEQFGAQVRGQRPGEIKALDFVAAVAPQVFQLRPRFDAFVATLALALGKAVADRLNCHVRQGYGMSEMSPVSHAIPFDRDDIALDTCGPTIANMECKLVDPGTGEEVAYPALGSDGVSEPGELVAKGVLTREEARHFERAERFFSTVRCHIHYLTNRADDRLSFDLQREIAERLGGGRYAAKAVVENKPGAAGRLAVDDPLLDIGIADIADPERRSVGFKRGELLRAFDIGDRDGRASSVAPRAISALRFAAIPAPARGRFAFTSSALFSFTTDSLRLMPRKP